MSEKNYDRKGRWRSKTVAFRMSPEENEELDVRVKVSGLTKQEYLINRALEKEIIVRGNPRVYIALKRQLEEVLQELKALHGETPSEELIDSICLINRTLYGMKGENKNDCP
jgi:predicted DNA-binding protein